MTFTLEQALKAQRALRQAADLAPEQFPVEAFVGMLSDEIDALRSRGKTDEEIAGVISNAANTAFSATNIRDHYASAEERGKA